MRRTPEAPRTDWLMAFDDLLTQRFRACTSCGRAPLTQWTVAKVGPRIVAYALCPRCDQQAPAWHQVHTLLVERYGVDDNARL
jgi:hypothetical protein